MPCRDGGPCWEDETEFRARKEQQDRLDKVTRLLCEVLTTYKKFYPLDSMKCISDECSAWFINHQEEDRLRLEAEKKASFQEQQRLKDRIKTLEAELKQTLDKLLKRG